MVIGLIGGTGVNAAPTFTYTGTSQSAPTLIDSSFFGGFTNFYFYYWKNISSGTTAVNVSWNFGTLTAVIAEYSGVDTTAPLEQHVFANSNFGDTNWSSGATPGTSTVGDLAVGFESQFRGGSTTETFNSPFTKYGGRNSDSNASALIGDVLGISGTSVTFSGTQSAGPGGGQNYAFCATFLASGGGPTTAVKAQSFGNSTWSWPI